MIPTVSVTSNIEHVSRYLTTVQRKQLPFAISQALTSTAFTVRKRLVGRTWDQAFTVRNRRFAGAAFRVDKATKRKLEAAVYDRLGRDFLARHAQGGTKRPASGPRLAVPTTRHIKRTATGKVPKARQPRNLRDRPDVFVARLRRGDAAIWQRTKRGGLKLLYTLPPSAQIDKTFRFFEDARRVALATFPREIRIALVKALRTAR